jgi:hypothetical protein
MCYLVTFYLLWAWKQNRLETDPLKLKVKYCWLTILPPITITNLVCTNRFWDNRYQVPGADSGGGAPPPKIGKNMIFWRKIVIFHTKYLKNFRASLGNWKYMIFWRKIVIFHTKYPKNFRASLCSAQFF